MKKNPKPFPLIMLVLLICFFAGSSCFSQKSDALNDAAKKAKLSGKLAMAQIDLDYMYDNDDKRVLDNNIDKMILKLKKDEINTVALQAFCDVDGNGETKGVYFASKNAPVVADVFNQAAKRIKKSGISVYAWMPTLSCQWISQGDSLNMVKAYDKKKLGWYKRSTPFSEKTRSGLISLFSDLARGNNIDGVLFQDDLFLNDFEDFSNAGKAAYLKEFGMELTNDIYKDSERMDEWTAFKTDSLNSLTIELMNEVKKYKPNAKFLRNIYAEAVLNPEAEEWYAEDFGKYLNIYDGTVVMAYPYMEGAKNPDKWMKNLLKITKKYAVGKQNKVIIKIQTFDWEREKSVSSSKLKKWIAELEKSGFKSYGLYPYGGQ